METLQPTAAIDTIPSQEYRGEDASPCTASSCTVPPVITRATVRVMRSYDYCHFEVTLSTEERTDFPDGFTRIEGLSVARIDALRKEAARLADKAVQQFRVAKRDADQIAHSKTNLEYLMEEAKEIEAIPEGERSSRQKGTLKALRDAQYHASRAPYDYQDDWTE